MLDCLTLKPEVFGIDISDLSLKIIKLKKKGSYFKLASFGEMEIGSGIIEGGEVKNENALVEIIKKAVSQVKGEKINTKHIIASLPEEKAFLEVIQMPLMLDKELGKAVYFEAENYIPLPMDKVYLDAQRVNPVLDHLDHTDVLIAALPKKTVDSYLSIFQKAGLRPLVFEIESQAVARALVKDEKSLETVLLMDFGAANVSFTIFSGYSLRFTTSLPISSNRFTEIMADKFLISFKGAEELKRKYGLEGGGGKEIINVLRPELSSLVDGIKTHISYYQTHSAHEHLSSQTAGVKKIVLCGGGSSLKGFSNFLSGELQMDVELGNPWSNVLPQPLKEVPGLSYLESLKYTTALGLALRGAINR